MKIIHYILIIFSIWKINYSNAQENTRIIEVLGSKKNDINTVLYYSGLTNSGKIDKDKVNKAIKNLYYSGCFSEIYVAITNKKVRIKVNENPYINKIYIRGNNKIGNKQIMKSISTTKKDNYSRFNLNADIKRIKLIYRKIGYFFVKIHLKIIKSSKNLVNIEFVINENKKTKIRKILFLGNKEFSTKSLNKVLFTKESIKKKISNGYLANQIIIDSKLLKRFYMSHGFINFRILSFNIKAINKSGLMDIYYIFSEGKKYKIGNINILTKIKKIRALKLKTVLNSKKNIIFNTIEIKTIINKLMNFLDKENFSEIKLRLKMIKKIKKNFIDVKIYIENNESRFIKTIKIKDKKTITLDNVITKEIKIYEGELNNYISLSNSKKEILGIAKMKVVNKKRRNLDINLRLKEIFTGLIKTSVGYQNKIGVTSVLSLNEYNFLNKGQIIEINLAKYNNNTDLEIKFNEPNFYKKCILSIDWVHKYSKSVEKKYGFIKESTTIFKLGNNMKKRFYYDIKLLIKSKYMKKKIKNKYFLLGNSIYYEKVDNKNSPSKGYILKLSQNISGGDYNLGYIYNNLNLNMYKKLYKKTILMITNKIAYIKKIDDKYIGEEDKLFIDEEYIRGFEKSGIGPRMKNSKFDSDRKNLGGQKLFISNIEILFPIMLINNLNIKGNIFADLGTLYKNKSNYNICYNKYHRYGKNKKIDKIISFFPVCNKKNGFNLDYINNNKKIRFAIGIGINFSNSFGRMKIDYGIPIKKEIFDNTSRIRFSIGTNLE